MALDRTALNPDYDRAAVQRDATAYAHLFFSSAITGVNNRWAGACRQDEAENMTRSAVRHLVSVGLVPADQFAAILETTARATQANFFWYPAYIWGFAMDELRSLLAEELGHQVPQTWLDEDA